MNKLLLLLFLLPGCVTAETASYTCTATGVAIGYWHINASSDYNAVHLAKYFNPSAKSVFCEKDN